MRQNRTEVYVSKSDVNLVVAETPEDSYVAGALWTKKGWHWWLSATTVTGEVLSGTVKGPYPTEKEARDAGYAAVDAAYALREGRPEAAAAS